MTRSSGVDKNNTSQPFEKRYEPPPIMPRDVEYRSLVLILMIAEI
jgi:hypothetical protein